MNIKEAINIRTDRKTYETFADFVEDLKTNDNTIVKSFDVEEEVLTLSDWLDMKSQIIENIRDSYSIRVVEILDDEEQEDLYFDTMEENETTNETEMDNLIKKLTKLLAPPIYDTIEVNKPLKDLFK
jgi:vacuolar-type H+-ATPase subunit I/STV1